MGKGEMLAPICRFDEDDILEPNQIQVSSEFP